MDRPKRAKGKVETWEFNRYEDGVWSLTVRHKTGYFTLGGTDLASLTLNLFPWQVRGHDSLYKGMHRPREGSYA